jgi:hypothetical protein
VRTVNAGERRIDWRKSGQKKWAALQRPECVDFRLYAPKLKNGLSAGGSMRASERSPMQRVFTVECRSQKSAVLARASSSATRGAMWKHMRAGRFDRKKAGGN